MRGVTIIVIVHHGGDRGPMEGATVIAGECESCGGAGWAPLDPGLAGSLTSFTPKLLCLACWDQQQ